MAHIEQGDYRGKHDSDGALDERIKEAVQAKVKDTRLSCGAASRIAEELGVPMEDVGRTADFLEVKIDKCQLGLFGYTHSKGKKRIMEPEKNPPSELEEAIRANLEKGKLPCTTQWRIAEDLGISRMAVCAAADGLGIKSSICQLGAF